jgi:two-component system chemotaxis sensor kinase CheA
VTVSADRLLGIFLGELDDQLVVMNADLLALEANPGDATRVRSLFRVAHTLKGAASAVGVDEVAEMCHSLETMLAHVRDQGLVLGAEQFRILFSAADSLAEAGRGVRAGQRVLTMAPGEPPAPDGQAARDYLRTDPDALDAVLASVEQILVAIDGVAARARQARAVSDLAGRTTAKEARRKRKHTGLNDLPIAPLSPRSRGDIGDDLRRLSEQAARLAVDAGVDARTLGNAGSELASRARRLRMRPFAEACEALPRVVRDLAGTIGKNVRLNVMGGDVQADRVVLDGLREALAHLVRNAVDHGVESPEARALTGKPSEALVTIAASVSGDSICVTVEDDGAGLDVPGIRASLERLGRTIPAGDDAAVAALFEGGVTTRTAATAISGRGVGLDLVRAAVERIHGTVRVEWMKGSGTTFTLQSPLTLATIRALLVKVGTETVALPTTHVERVRRISPGDLGRAEGKDILAAGNGAATPPVRVVSLARLLGPPLSERPLDRNSSGVVLEAQGRRLAVIVDELVAEQLVIVRRLDSARASLPHLSGVAILTGGRIALVANVAALLARAFDTPSGLTIAGNDQDPEARRRRVLVVDDSITTRMLEQSVLEAAGYEVRTAVDGVNAWEMLSENEWDLVVSDVDMPRMDGFSLCAAIRSSSRLAHTRVVLVTALEKEEYRARGLEVGADAYIGKSSFDQRALLETIQQLFD